MFQYLLECNRAAVEWLESHGTDGSLSFPSPAPSGVRSQSLSGYNQVMPPSPRRGLADWDKVTLLSLFPIHSNSWKCRGLWWRHPE